MKCDTCKTDLYTPTAVWTGLDCCKNTHLNAVADALSAGHSFRCAFDVIPFELECVCDLENKKLKKL